MRQQFQPAFVAWRFYLTLIFICLIVVGLIVRMIDLTIINRHFLQAQGDARSLRVIYSSVPRGMITDRNGSPLAVSASVYSVWVNPEDFLAEPSQIASLSQLIKMPVTDVSQLIQQAEDKNRVFLYLKRGISPETANQIKALKIPGVYLRQDYKRFYPEGEISAHLIGMTNVDDQGQEGLELIYNQWLSGQTGKKLVVKDRMGRDVSEIKEIQMEKPSNDLMLSIDNRIQYLAYRELMNGVQENLAASGSIVVLDIKTGEVLAMVNQPSFNPNNRVAGHSDHFRNRAVTDTFEPGSTIKAFSVATALQSGLYTPDTVIDTSPGWITVDHHVMRDEHRKGPMSVTQILQMSSDVGVIKIMLSLPVEPFWHLLQEVGFGETTQIGFPGERSGALVRPKTWKPLAIATLAIGYGVSVTALQLAHAYATLANNGVKIPLSLLKVDSPPAGKQVMDPKITKQVIGMLETVINSKDGTARAARVAGYTVAGKTGTARLVGAHGYEKRYSSSFVGIAPATHPRLVVAVIIRDPRGKQYYGGFVSAPVFQKVMEGALRILNVPPDDLASLEKPVG